MEFPKSCIFLKRHMRIFSLIITIILSESNSFGQDSIAGCYSSNFAVIGWFGTHLKLNQDSTFEYQFAGDLFYDKTSGTYLINKNRILLNFIVNTDSLEISLPNSLGNISTTKFPLPPNPSANNRPTSLIYKNGRLIVYDKNGTRIRRVMNGKNKRKKYYLIRHSNHSI